MPCELVVLDMAGTTVYDGDAVHACLTKALRAAELSVTRDDVNDVMGLPKPIAIRMLLDLRGSASKTTESAVTAIHKDFEHKMLEFYRTDPSVREIEGAAETFRKLKREGIKVVLDTGFSRPIVDEILIRLGWNRDGLLDATVASDEVARGRPFADLIVRAMELTGVSDPQNVAKVGDTPSDLQEGEAADCGWVIGVTQGSHTAAQLEPFAHTHLIGTIADLPALLLG